MKDWSNLNLGMMIQNTFYTNKPACTLEDIFPVAQCDIGVCLSWNTVVVEYFDTVETPVDGEPADNCWLQEHCIVVWEHFCTPVVARSYTPASALPDIVAEELVVEPDDIVHVECQSIVGIQLDGERFHIVVLVLESTPALGHCCIAGMEHLNILVSQLVSELVDTPVLELCCIAPLELADSFLVEYSRKPVSGPCCIVVEELLGTADEEPVDIVAQEHSRTLLFPPAGNFVWAPECIAYRGPVDKHFVGLADKPLLACSCNLVDSQLGNLQEPVDTLSPEPFHIHD